MNITNEVVGLFLAVMGAVWGGYKWVESRVSRVEENADSARRDLEAHKLYAANNYVSKDGLRELRDEIRDTRMELKSDIKDVGDKVDEQKDKKGFVYE